VAYYSCSDAKECGATYPSDTEGNLKDSPPCPECGKAMVVRLSRGEPFLGCSAYPECRGVVSFAPKSGKGRGARGRGTPGRRRAKMLATDIACEKCGKKMVVRMSRRGPFLACPGYPKCKNAKDAPAELVEKFNAMAAEAEGGEGADDGKEAGES